MPTLNADTITLKDLRNQAAAGLYYETVLIRALPTLDGTIDNITVDVGQYTALGGQLLAKRQRGQLLMANGTVDPATYTEHFADKRWYSAVSGTDNTIPFAALMHVWSQSISSLVTIREGRLTVQYATMSEPLVFPINADAWAKVDNTPKVPRDYAATASELWAQTGTTIRPTETELNGAAVQILNTALQALKDANPSRTPGANNSERFAKLLPNDVKTYMTRSEATRV